MEIKRRTGKGDIGDMNQRVQFKMPLKSRDSTTNEEIRTYVTSNEVWAQVDYSTRSQEDEVASRKTALVYATFTMYFREAVRPTWRLVYRDAEFEIESILPGPNRQYMVIEAVQREPWRDDYQVAAASGFTTVDGDYVLTVERGPTQESFPTFGGLTWTSSGGDTWTIT